MIITQNQILTSFRTEAQTGCAPLKIWWRFLELKIPQHGIQFNYCGFEYLAFKQSRQFEMSEPYCKLLNFCSSTEFFKLTYGFRLAFKRNSQFIKRILRSISQWFYKDISSKYRKLLFLRTMLVVPIIHGNYNIFFPSSSGRIQERLLIIEVSHRQFKRILTFLGTKISLTKPAEKQFLVFKWWEHTRRNIIEIIWLFGWSGRKNRGETRMILLCSAASPHSLQPLLAAPQHWPAGAAMPSLLIGSKIALNNAKCM